MKQWIELFRSIGKEIYKKVAEIAGSKEAKRVIGEGKFGDNTVYIDKFAEDKVINRIFNSGMACSILTEEKGWVDVKGKYPIVIVDPIDGSLNAKRGIPYYALSIGLAFDKTTESIECGYVINLANGDEFWAIKRNGAFFNGERIASQNLKRISVVSVEGLKKETELKLLQKIFMSFYRVRQSGSTALDMCYTATGAFDTFLHLDKARIVDYAAAKVILEEVGGGLYEWISENPFECEISMEKVRPFIATPEKKLIDKIIDALK